MTTKYFNEHLKTYYLIFTDTPTWRQYVLRKGFGHCYLLTHDKYNWQLFNPRHLFMHTQILPLQITDKAWLSVSKPSDSILKLELYQIDNIESFGMFGLRTCVSIIKYMLGFKDRAQTPYQLYKRLLSMSEKERNMAGIHSVHIYQ